MSNIFFPAEWTKNATIQLTWPHMGTDWSLMIENAKKCFISIADEILKRQNLLIVCRDRGLVEYELSDVLRRAKGSLMIKEVPTNDTWARDHAPITVFEDEIPLLYDFGFNGWGLKFPSSKDNQINRNLLNQKVFSPHVKFQNQKNFILEGGSIETDGKGTLLTTAECLLSPNRNSFYTKLQIEQHLKDLLGIDRVLWLNHGYIAGDDTDSHIDTLARFCDEHTIAYVQSADEKDEHYDQLKKMEQELKSFVDYEGNPYNLIPLPMTKPLKDSDNERLPATYANFLIMDEAILLPIYNSEKSDKEALEKLQIAFPNKQIVPIDCTPLIYQHGSLHCVTMQYPEGIIKF